MFRSGCRKLLSGKWLCSALGRLLIGGSKVRILPGELNSPVSSKPDTGVTEKRREPLASAFRVCGLFSRVFAIPPVAQRSLVRARAFGVRVQPPGLRSHAETLSPKLSDSRVTIPRRVTTALTLAGTKIARPRSSGVRRQREGGPPALAVVGRHDRLTVDAEERLQIPGQQLAPLLVPTVRVPTLPRQRAVALGEGAEQLPLLGRPGVAAIGHTHLRVVVRPARPRHGPPRNDHRRSGC